MKHIEYTSLSLKYKNGKLDRLNWDIVVRGEEYFGYHLSTDFENYDESDKEHYIQREDTWFIAPRFLPENKIIENLISVRRRDIGVRWSVKIEEDAYIKNKWGEDSLRTSVHYTIYRNDKEFHTDSYGTLEGAYVFAMEKIYKFTDSPAEIGQIDWDKKLIGRKIWYDDQPCIIEEVWDSELWLIPDKSCIEKFSTPRWAKEEESFGMCKGWWEEDYANGLKAEILSEKIDWFRD